MNLSDAFYEVRFENAFLRTRGDAFQTLFEKLMGLAYKADFMACRPWGNRGDRKNDGFLKSERRLFQVYAPNELGEAEAKRKISEDFAGAKEHWAEHFDKWVFVHNAVDGLPPHVHKLLLDFEADNPGVKLEPWGLEELRGIFRQISPIDKAAWFGPAPTEETKLDLGFADLKVVLESIAALPAPPSTTVREVPAGKIAANALSESTAFLLKAGMAKAQLVSDFFAAWYDASLGERLAEAFREEYRRLRSIHTPAAIFSELCTWAGGNQRGGAAHELAVLTVIAYYFERCDIFEEPHRGAV